MKNGTASERLAELSVAEESGCIRFTGSIDKSGYGRIMINRVKYGAHRLAYELANGPIPDGYVVRHKCDNPSCINPSHLEVGTQAENIKDKVTRGRQASGCSIGVSKLTEEIVRDIRSSGLKVSLLAERYGVSTVSIRNILRRKTWQHVE
ncbi:HNH endonuclease signature motif containing protein [Escherichia coli]|uniref:HNH endonuclease signature motif containing protein n=1 Tax=Escherichia coli TaxID=562 RepID=UPI001559C6FB|nr:HNH endonuclease signature motif containing protein [Escherichia coli]